MIGMFTHAPARILKLDRGTLAMGAAGDVTILDPNLDWTYDVNQSQSKSRNSPFHGRAFRGGAVAAIVAGKVVYTSSTILP
jgi:dihydroorotase